MSSASLNTTKVLASILIVAIFIILGVGTFLYFRRNVSETDKIPISIKSEMTSYKVTLEDEKLLRERFKEISFLSEGIFTDEQIYIEPQSVTITFTGTPLINSMFTQSDKEGEVEHSVNGRIDDSGNVYIEVYVKEDLLALNSDFDPRVWLDMGVLRSAYLLNIYFKREDVEGESNYLNRHYLQEKFIFNFQDNE